MLAKEGRRPAAPEAPRIPSLDGLRAASILAVIVGHAAGTSGFPNVLPHLDHLGYLGVRVFFVISGFLITTLLLAEKESTGRISISRFYLRRTIRIWPAFYTYLAAVLLLDAAGIVDLGLWETVAAATFTINFLDERDWTLNHIWSLAVEEQFYLLWPLLVIALRRKTLIYVSLGLLALCPLLRALMWHVWELSETAMTRHFQAAYDALVLGGCLAAAAPAIDRVAALRATVTSRAMPLIGVLIVALASASYAISPGLFYVWMQSGVNVGVALVLMHAITVREGALFAALNCRPAVFIGVLSYSLYLWQELFLNPFSTRWFAAFPQNLLLTGVCAYASYRLVEKPFGNLRARLRSALQL